MELDFLAYDKTPLGDDGLFINFQKSEGLSVLQRKIIAAVNPLRETVSRNKWPDDEQCVIESIEYGYPISRYHFPHITLGKFSNTGKRDAALQSLQDNQGSPLRIKTVAVVEHGEHGTAKKIIKEYLL